MMSEIGTKTPTFKVRWRGGVVWNEWLSNLEHHEAIDLARQLFASEQAPYEVAVVNERTGFTVDTLRRLPLSLEEVADAEKELEADPIELPERLHGPPYDLLEKRLRDNRTRRADCEHCGATEAESCRRPIGYPCLRQT